MLTPDPTSSLLKIGLYFGPVVNGYCESCTNVLNKNPGSQSLNSAQDNNYIYEIIAVSK
jgi:hypothetical protein